MDKDKALSLGKVENLLTINLNYNTTPVETSAVTFASVDKKQGYVDPASNVVF